jgi:hypothetical protein
MNGEQAGATLEELAKKYGYTDPCHIKEYIRIYKNKDAILEILGHTRPNVITHAKAMKVLRELKLSFFA